MTGPLWYRASVTESTQHGLEGNTPQKSTLRFLGAESSTVYFLAYLPHTSPKLLSHAKTAVCARRALHPQVAWFIITPGPPRSFRDLTLSL